MDIGKLFRDIQLLQNELSSRINDFSLSFSNMLVFENPSKVNNNDLIKSQLEITELNTNDLLKNTYKASDLRLFFFFWTAF